MLLLCALASAAEELDIVFQDKLQGGLAIDGSSVATAYDGGLEPIAGPDFELQMPATARVRAAYVVLVAKNQGFLGGEAALVRLNGQPLSDDDEVASGTRYRVFEVDAAAYGITGPGRYSWEEAGAVEDQLHDGAGVGGATLAVVWEDAGVRARRQVTLGVGYGNATGSSFTVAGLTRGAVVDRLTVSLGVAWECSTEQGGSVLADGEPLAQGVGGRDDSPQPDGACRVDSNSLWTVGSFGAADDGTLVGVAGDEPGAEPADGTAANSRLSDELWVAPYAADGGLRLDYSAAVPDGWMATVALSLDLDTDHDGIGDADDGCTDVDGDGYGDAGWFPDCPVDCDDQDADSGLLYGYPDRDGDGFGDGADPACAPADGLVANGGDCDDTDAAVHPDAQERCDPANVDEDCDGLADDADPDATGQTDGYVDFDGDGFGGTATGHACDVAGTDDDCNDANAQVYPGAPDPAGDGIDQDCDGRDAQRTDGVDIFDSDEPGDCGCSTPAPGAGWAALVAGVALLRRRRGSAR